MQDLPSQNTAGESSLERSTHAVAKVVVFDIGNVLIEWDMRHVYRPLFGDEAKMTRFLEETQLIKWNVEQDKGREWPKAEELLISDFPHYTAEIRAFRARWHEMVPGEIGETVRVHEALLKRGVPLYAVTNFALDTFRETQDRFPFLYNFRDIVVSAAVGFVKPDPAIFRCLLSRNNLEAADCLFIDDSQPNVAAARSVGMWGHHYQDIHKLEEELKRHSLF